MASRAPSQNFPTDYCSLWFSKIKVLCIVPQTKLTQAISMVTSNDLANFNIMLPGRHPVLSQFTNIKAIFYCSYTLLLAYIGQLAA